MFREAREASERFAVEENCGVEWSRIWSIEHGTVPGAGLTHQIVRTGRSETLAAAFNSPQESVARSGSVQAGVGVVMMFVQSLKGIGRNEIEDTLEERLEIAVTAIKLACIADAAEWIQQALMKER